MPLIVFAATVRLFIYFPLNIDRALRSACSASSGEGQTGHLSRSSLSFLLTDFEGLQSDNISYNKASDDSRV